MKLVGTLSPIREVVGVLSAAGGGSAGYYEGPYEVTPAVYEQSLSTAFKVMREDVTVFEIPYAEVSNVHGTTVTIAS